MAIQRARSAEEYAGWVKQTKFEVGDLKECLLYDMEELGHFPLFPDPSGQEIKGLFDDMCNGEHAFGREDLPFMEVANRHRDEIPFHILLQQINETHRKGLDVGEDK